MYIDIRSAYAHAKVLSTQQMSLITISKKKKYSLRGGGGGKVNPVTSDVVFVGGGKFSCIQSRIFNYDPCLI